MSGPTTISTSPATVGYDAIPGQYSVTLAPGIYDIVAVGAAGGAAGSDAGGTGAEIGGDFTFMSQSSLTIDVGSGGGAGAGTGGNTFGAGGGGASYVVVAGSTQPLVDAGGGGGGASTGPATATAGIGGQTGTSGSAGNSGVYNLGGSGGSGGSGGGGGTGFAATKENIVSYGGAAPGGGGGGWLSQGQDGVSINFANYGVSGVPIFAGGAGGSSGGGGAGGSGLSSDGVSGYYGGGGGGGGYSGGGGGGGGNGNSSSSSNGITGGVGGGGGGSYLAASATNPVLVAGVDGGGGVSAAANGSVTITLLQAFLPSTIKNTQASQGVTNNATIPPFAGVSITDLNAGNPTDAITITLTGSGGTPTDADGKLSGAGLTETSAGVYTLATTDAATLTGELQKLTFTPTLHQVAPASTVATTFTLSDLNSVGQTTTDSTTSVVATAVNDPATISGTATGSVTEDRTLTASGTLTVADPDFGQAGFQTPLAASLTGTYGAFTFDPSTGEWGYTLNDTSQIVQALGAGQQVTDTLSVTSLDGTATRPITVTINGTDDAPTLKSQTLSVGSVRGGQTSSNLYSQVLANVQDVDTIDQGKLTITSVAPATGTTGAVFLDSTSKLLTYTADAYNAKQTTDSFTYTAADPEGATVSGTITVPITPGTLQPTVLGTPGNDTLTANPAGAVVFAGRGNDTITTNGAKSTVYGGPGTNTLLLNAAQQTVVLEQGGTDNISGFNLKNDVLDLTQVLAEAQKSFNPADFQLTSSGSNATLSYIGSPSFGSGALATLFGVGPGVTLQTLINDSALKVA